MPGAELRLIRRRIRTVQSTMKITRAMELIAASRIVRAQQRVGAGQPYAAKMREVVANLSQASGAASHPLLAARPLATAGILVVASDRGLAGAYNTNVIRLAEARLHQHAAAGVACRLYVVGKRALTYFRYRGHHIERSFLGVTDSPKYEDAREIGRALMGEYEAGEVDAVEAFSTRYRSGPHPDGGGPAVAAGEPAGDGGEGGGGGLLAMSRRPPSSWPACCPAMWRAPCSASSWRRRPPSTPPGAGR